MLYDLGPLLKKYLSTLISVENCFILLSLFRPTYFFINNMREVICVS